MQYSANFYVFFMTSTSIYEARLLGWVVFFGTVEVANKPALLKEGQVRDQTIKLVTALRSLPDKSVNSRLA